MNELATSFVNYADVEARARQSFGISEAAIYRMVVRALQGRHRGGGTIADVGCGAGQLWPFLRKRFDTYIGVDVIRYEGFPNEAKFHRANLDLGQLPLPDQTVLDQGRIGP